MSDFHYPTIVNAGFLPPETVAALSALCVSPDTAHPGDILAVQQSVRFDHGHACCYPITTFVVCGESGPVWMDYGTLAESQQARAAHGAMMLQQAGVLASSFLALCAHLDPADGEALYADLVMTPAMTLMAVDSFADNILEGTFFDEERNQEQIDSCMLLVFAGSSSAHDMVRMRRDFARTRIIFDRLFPVHDADHDTTLTLRFPDKKDILEL